MNAEINKYLKPLPVMKVKGTVILFSLFILLGLAKSSSAQCTVDFFMNNWKNDTFQYRVTFNGWTSAPSSNINYRWDFGDGLSDTTTLYPVHLYHKAGNYNVCLTLTDTVTSCTDSTCHSVSLSPQVCDSSFTVNRVSDTSIGFYTYKPTTKIKWDFGDGTTSTRKYDLHTFKKSGTYTVCLRVYCGYYDSAENCTTVVIAPPCKALYTKSSDSTQKFRVILLNKSSNSGTSKYYWNFGDSSYSSKRNPTHQFSSFGKFLVCITVTEDFCSSTFCDTLNLDSSGMLLKKGGKWEMVVVESNAKVNRPVESNIKIYPNPVGDKLFVDWGALSESYTKMEIINTQGQISFKRDLDEGTKLVEIITESLKPGLYLVRFSNNQTSVFTKIWKN